MSINQLKVETNCVIWNNIHLPHPSKSLTSPDFCLDGLKWHFQVSCTWFNSAPSIGLSTSEERWNFFLQCSTNAGSSNTYIIIPYIKTAQKYVRIAKTIGETVSRFSLSRIIGSGDIITVLFFFSLDSLAPLNFKDQAIEVHPDKDKKEHLCLENLSKDIVQLFNKDGFADATVKCGSKSFSVHRNILSTRSTVFSSMFENDMKEKNTGVVEIVDLDPNILEQFLLYLYSGKVEEMSIDMALKLYKMADKYAVCSLRQLCVFYILEHMSKDIVCEALLLADQSQDIEFLDSIASSAASMPGFLKSTEWKEFAFNYTAVAVKVYSKYFDI